MNQILLALGLKTDGFAAGLKDVKDQTKSLKSEWKGLKDVMIVAGPALAMLGFFRSMIEHAREAKGAIDENTQSVRNLGDGWDYLVKGAKDFGVQAVGLLARVGENLVDMTRYAWNGADAFEAEAAALKQSEEGVARMAKNQIEANAHRAEFLKITEQLKSIEEKRVDLARGELNVSQAFGYAYINLLETKRKLNELSQGEKTLTEFNLQQRQLTIDVAKAQLLYEQASLAVGKDQREINAKGFAEDLKWVKAQDAASQKHKEYLFNQKFLTEQIADLQKQESTLKKKAVGDSVKQVELDAVRVKLAEARLTLEEQIAVAVANARKEAQTQVDLAKLNAKITADFMAQLYMGGHSSQDIQRSSDAALKDLLQKNNAEANKLQQADAGNAFHFGSSIDIQRLQNENTRIKAELELRSDIRKGVDFYGVEGARKNFKGDPLVYDKLVDEFTRTQDRTDKTNQLLSDLVTQFKGQSGSQNSVSAQIGKLTDATQVVAQQLARVGISTGG
jgi:hypothetical protein